MVRLILVLLALVQTVPAALRVLPPEFNADKEQQMMRSYLRQQVHAKMDQRLKDLEAALQSPKALTVYQEKRRGFLRWTLGEMPKRTPLNARVTGVLREDGFTIEKVLFESRPGFHVTSNVYRPAGKGPFPPCCIRVATRPTAKRTGNIKRPIACWCSTGSWCCVTTPSAKVNDGSWSMRMVACHSGPQANTQCWGQRPFCWAAGWAVGCCGTECARWIILLVGQM